ncbi:GH25 family lysozyme [Streptomyces sp. NPDC048045]|uniref:GH25 family lysozyme n=1 Tax=Streptomyces sp. NPDC048045 TaxID=3154710 RepID=UPI00342D663A
MAVIAALLATPATATATVGTGLVPAGATGPVHGAPGTGRGHGTQPRPAAGAAGAAVRGLDVSAYQETVDWSAVAAGGASFAYVKATEGTTYISSRFSGQYDGAAEARLLETMQQTARREDFILAGPEE